MKRIERLLITLIVLGILVGGWIIVLYIYGVSRATAPTVYVSVEDTELESLEIDGAVVLVERLQTFKDRMRGLGGRDFLDKNHGMWFVFGYVGSHGMWMRGMRFALDIVWFDSDMRVVHIEENIVPETFPKIFYPAVPASFVLEVPAGFVESHGIVLGDVASFSDKLVE